MSNQAIAGLLLGALLALAAILCIGVAVCLTTKPNAAWRQYTAGIALLFIALVILGALSR